MDGETPATASRAREIAIFRMITGTWLVLAITFGVLELAGVIHL